MKDLVLKCSNCSLNENGVCMAFSAKVSKDLLENVCKPYNKSQMKKKTIELQHNLILENKADLSKYNALETGDSFEEYLNSKIDPETGFLNPIDITELTDTMFKGNNYILNKYFFYKDHSLDRMQCFNITPEEYEEEVLKSAKLPDDEINLKLETANIYWKRKIFSRIIARDLNVSPKKIDMSEYIHNPEYYEMYDFDDNRRYLEDKFREEEHEAPQYVDRTCVVDRKIIDSLYDTCIILIKNRLAMIFEVYPVICAIRDIIEYTDGYRTNCLKEQMATILHHYNRINRILNSYSEYIDFDTDELTVLVKDQEAYDLVKWIKAGNNDYTLYANGKTTQMYIEEYHKIICKLNDIYGDYETFGFDEDEYKEFVSNLEAYQNEPYVILLNYIHNVINNPIDEHISKYFALPDIDNYLMRYIQGLNNKKIKINEVKDRDDLDEENLVIAE